MFTELPSGLWGLAVDGVYDLSELPVEPLPVEPRHLVGLLLGALKVSATERALVLNPIQLISVVTRARWLQPPPVRPPQPARRPAARTSP